MQCSICRKSVETKPTAHGERIPRGWKRHAGQVYCGDCWADRYVLRAITIPVVRPLGEGIGWPQLREALAEAWSHATAATNWMTTQLFVRDEQRKPKVEKCPKQPKTYLYPETRQQFPELPSQVCAALENSVKAKYAKRRYQVLWTCEASLANARYPQPAIAPNQSWRPSYEPAGKDGGDLVPCVSVALLNGQRFLLQLRGGTEFRRQLGDFKQLVDDTAIKGELAILRQRVNGSDHRNGGRGRDGGGQQFATRVMVKMVGWFPRKERGDWDGTLYVHTVRDCFAVALDEKQNKLRVWNGDQVRRWISEHRRQLQRWSDDQKAENRPTASFQSRREAAVNKYKNRIASFIKETAAQIAGVAKRQRFATVRLDDRDRDYLGDGRFDWSGFRTYLAQRLNQDGVTLELASGEVTTETGDPLAETEA